MFRWCIVGENSLTRFKIIFFNLLKACNAKRVYGFKNLEYQERLNHLGLTKLVDRRIRGDLIQMYKIQRGHDQVQWPSFVQQKHGDRRYALRGHNETIRREKTSNTTRHNFFMNRVSRDWNKLPAEVISATSINLFKERLDKYIALPK